MTGEREGRIGGPVERIAKLAGCGPDESSAEAAEAIADGLKRISAAADTDRGKELKKMLREGMISREEFFAEAGKIADETQE